MQFIDLKKQYAAYQPEIDQAIQNVLNHGRYIRGPELAELEGALAKFVGAKHCLGNSSGTTALQIALMALDVKPGDEVITTPFSFFATAEVIALLGATPVFIDIDPVTYNLDANLLEAAITEKTKAIMPVSLYGQCADMQAINAIAAKHQLPVIEDAAQSLGATHHGVQSCNLSTIGCTSFFPSKPLGCYGDGGACFTNDDALAEKMRMILNHGQRKRYTHELIGINGRLDTLQAAILLAKLPHFQKEVERRQQVAGWYAQHLAEHIKPPTVLPHNTSVYGQYTVMVENRTAVLASLKAAGVPTAVHYPIPMHKQPVFADTALGAQQFPVADTYSDKVMSLPFYPYMSEEEVKQVTAALNPVANTLETADAL